MRLLPIPAYNNSQRIGVIVLLILIVTAQLVYYFVDFTPQQTLDLSSDEISRFQREIDSLKLIEVARRKPKIYPFNPSFLTDYKAYKLGMSVAEIDRLLAYRKTGKYINSISQFQKVTGVSDSLLAVISPYFKFPDWVLKKQKKLAYKHPNSKIISKEDVRFTGIKQDLNTVTIQDLVKIKGVGNKLAGRIIKYRTKLKGYLLDQQLYEVWYLDKSVADRILARYSVINAPKITKININTASFKQVLHAPYMNYELTKKIFEYRDEMAEIQSMEELKKIEGFPLDKFDRISLYLTAE